jgi:hypothetical protein
MALVQSQQSTGSGLSLIAHAAVVFVGKLWEQAPLSTSAQESWSAKFFPLRHICAQKVESHYELSFLWCIR